MPLPPAPRVLHGRDRDSGGQTTAEAREQPYRPTETSRPLKAGASGTKIEDGVGDSGMSAPVYLGFVLAPAHHSSWGASKPAGSTV